VSLGSASPSTSRDKSDCHFGKAATEYDRNPGIKWAGCAAERQSDLSRPLRRSASQTSRAPPTCRGQGGTVTLQLYASIGGRFAGIYTLLILLRWLVIAVKTTAPLQANTHAPAAQPRQRAARAGYRRFWLSSALHAHTKASYKMDFHSETLRALNRPGRPGPRPARAHEAVRRVADLRCTRGFGHTLTESQSPKTPALVQAFGNRPRARNLARGWRSPGWWWPFSGLVVPVSYSRGARQCGMAPCQHGIICGAIALSTALFMASCCPRAHLAQTA
jgi:hypothetical protein